MIAYVVDASVAVKWLVQEEHSDSAARLLDPENSLVAPELIFAEASNAIWAMWRRGDIDRADFAESVETLKSAPIAIPSTMRQLAASAGRLAIDLNHPTYDCYYLALAMQEQLPVVTADRRFHNVVRAHPYLADRIVHIETLE